MNDEEEEVEEVEASRRRKVEAGKAKLAEFRQRKAKGDGAHPEKEKKKGKRTPLHQHGLATEEHALTSDETEVGVDVSVKTIVGEQSLAEDDASGGLGSFEPETREDNSSEVPPPLMDRDTDVLMALQITQFEAAIQQRDEIITQLSANLQQALSSRDGVQQETQHLTTHIQSLQQQLQQASEMLRSTRQLSQTQELAQTQQQLSTCQKLLCQKTSELLRLRSRLELARTTEQQAAVASLETGPDGLAQGTENHKEHILVLQKELQECNATANKLEATLSQKEAIILMLQQTLHSKDGSPVSTSASTTETEATLCERTENVGEAERTVAELQREISSKDLAMEELRMRLSASTEKEEQLSRENFKLLNDLDNLSKKEGRPDGNLTQLAESDWERREGELRTLLGEEHDRQLAELGSQMRQEVKRQQRDIDELTENNSKLNESLLQLKEFNSQLNASLRDSQAQLSSLQEQLSSASSASTEMDARHMRELENFCVKLEILEKGRTEAQGRVSELEELNAEMSRGREEAQRALEQIREQQNKDTEGLREALGLEYKGSIDKLTADVENLNVALSQSAEELRSMKQTLELKYIEEMEGLKQSLQQEQKENVDKLLADNERLNKELSLSQEALKSELGKVPANKNDPRSIEDQCSRELENEKEALVQEYKGNLEKLEAELKTLKEDLVHAKQEAVRALEEQQQRHIAEVDILNETLRQEHKVSLDKLLVDIENLRVTLSQHKQEAQSALENQQQQHLLSQNVQKETMAQEHKENVDKLLGDLERLKEELLNNKEETQSSLEKVKQQHDIEMKVLKESLSQENKVTVDNLQVEVEKLNNELSRSRLEADNRYEQMKQDHSRQVEVLQEQLKEQQKGTQDDVCKLEKLSQHHREEMKELEEALRLEHKETMDKLLADTEKLNTELTLSRQGTQEQVQQQQSRHTEEVQKMREQHIKELELLKKTADQEHTMRVNRLTTDIEKLGAELSLSKEEALHAANKLHEQHTRELEQLKESLTKENKQNTEKLLADLEKSHNFTLKESQQKQKDVDNLAQQLEEKHRLSLEVTLKDVENQSRVAIEKSMAELDNKHAEELAALKEDFREKMEKLRQEKKSLELEQHQSEEDIGGILRELEGCVTFQEILKISASSSDNVHAPGPILVPSNPSAEAVADPQALNSDPAFQKQGRQVKQLICALRQQCIAMKERLEVCMEEKKPCELTATAVVQSRIHQQDAQCQCESNSTLDAASQSMVDGAADTGRAQLSTAGDEQGQRSVTVSTAIPPADEFNALLQEKRVLEETVSDLHKTCNSQQKEIASLKAQTGDDEVEKTQVLCKGCGGVAELNAGSLTDVQTGAVGEPDLAGPTGPIPQAAPPSHVPPQPYLLHKPHLGRDECRLDLKSVDSRQVEMVQGPTNFYEQETKKLTPQFTTWLTGTMESHTQEETEKSFETTEFTAEDDEVLMDGSSRVRCCEQYPDKGYSYPTGPHSHQFADACSLPTVPSREDIQGLSNALVGPSQPQDDCSSGSDTRLSHNDAVDCPGVISKHSVTPECDRDSKSTADHLQSPDTESLDRPLVHAEPPRSDPDGDSLARDFDDRRPVEVAEGFSEMRVTIPLPVGELVPCAGDSDIDVHIWLYRCRGSQGSSGSGRHRLTAQISLPSPPFAVEQAQDVHVSLLKGWAAGSPPHDGPDGKVTMTPAPADQEACERGVQQRRGRPDSEPEQGSKAQLVKQKAELQEELGRVNVQVQVQQKGHKQQGHKQQQQRKLHRKQQKKHPGMVLVQHMSVVPEEGQEGQAGQEHDDVERRGDGTEQPLSSAVFELRENLNDREDRPSDDPWSHKLDEGLRRGSQEMHSSATPAETETDGVAHMVNWALASQKPVAVEQCSTAAPSFKGKMKELLGLLSLLESSTIQKCREEDPDTKLFRSLEAELHSLQVLLEIKDAEVELLQQQVQAWSDQQQSAESKQKIQKSTFTHFHVSLEDLNASVRDEGTASGNPTLQNGDYVTLQKQVLQKQDEIKSLQEKIQQLQPLGCQVKEMEKIFDNLKRQLVHKELAIVSLRSLVCELRLEQRRGLEGGCREEPGENVQDMSDIAQMTLTVGKDPELQCLQSCIAEVDHLKERLNAMSRGTGALKLQLSQKEMQTEKFELCIAELETLKKQLDYVARDCDGLKDRLAVKNLEMQTLVIPSFQEAVKGQAGDAIRSYQALCAQLEWQNTEIRSLRAHIVELEVLRHQFQSLKEDYTSLKWQLSQKDDEIDTMEFRIQELQSVYSSFMDESDEQVDTPGGDKTSPSLPRQMSVPSSWAPTQNFDTRASAGASNPESEFPGADAAPSSMQSQTNDAAEAKASDPNSAAAAAARQDRKGEQRQEHGGRTAVQGGAQEDADDATRCDMSGVPAAPQAAGGDQRASVEEVHMLRLALAQKEEELEALRVCMSTLQGAAEQASGSGLHSDEQTPHDAAEPSNADSNVRQQTHLYKATETISINMPSQPLLVAAPEGLMPELVMDPKGITVCTKAAADSGNVNQGQHLKSDKVPPQKHLAAGHPKSISSRGSATSQGNIPGETRTLSRTEITNKQKPAAKSANVKKREPASQTKPANRAARATPPTVPCGTCKHLEEERDGLMEGLRLERETCRQLQRRLQVLQQQRACTGVSGDATVAGQVGLRGGHSMAQVDLVMEPRKGSPCMQVVTHREESEEPNLPMIDDSASGVVTEMQASTCLEAAGKVSFLRGSQTEEGAADLKTPNGNGDAAQASEGSRVIASDGGSSDIAHLSDSTDMLRRHSLMQCACRRLQLVSTTTRDLLSQISIRVISVVDLAQDEEVAQLVQRLKELDVEIAHSEADLTWDSRSASGDPLGRVARQLSELYGRVAALSEEKEELNAVVLELTRSLQRRAARTPPGCASGSEPPASSLRNERALALRRADRSSPTAERALLCVPVSKFQSLHRRFTRAESQRRALLHQKRYLLLVLGSFAGAEQPALTLLARPHVELLIAQAPAAPRAAARGRFRVAARAVAATCRLRRLLQKQQRQESCPAYGWKVDVPAKAAFTAPGELYHRRTLDAIEREHFWNCPPWVSHSTPCVEEHRNPNFFLQDYIHKLESIQLRLGPYYTEASSFTRLAKKP